MDAILSQTIFTFVFALMMFAGFAVPLSRFFKWQEPFFKLISLACTLSLPVMVLIMIIMRPNLFPLTLMLTSTISLIIIAIAATLRKCYHLMQRRNSITK